MTTWLLEMAFSSLRSLAGAILSSLGPVGVIALLAGGLLLLHVPAALLRFVVRPRNLAMVAAVLVGCIGVMLRGSPAVDVRPPTGPLPPPPVQPVEPPPPTVDHVLPEKLVTFEPPPAVADIKPPNATCGHCGADFYASWNKKTRCPQCGFVMDAERAIRENSGPVGPDLTNNIVLELDKKYEAKREETYRKEAAALKLETGKQNSQCPGCGRLFWLGEHQGLYYYECGNCGERFSGGDGHEAYLGLPITRRPPTSYKLREVTPLPEGTKNLYREKQAKRKEALAKRAAAKAKPYGRSTP